MTAVGPTYVRNPAIAVTEIDEETFLVEPAEGEVFYLDEISSALWRYLAEPRPLPDVVDVFTSAFPDVDASKIEADIRAALDDMVARDLVVTRGE